jgi:hypothetical protein
MDGLNELINIVGKKEDLHPDMAARVVNTGDFLMIQHPLMHTFYTPGFESILNDGYRAKLKAIAEYRAEGKYDFIVSCLVEKPHRLDALIGYAEYMDDKTYWKTVSDVWTGMEYFYDDMEQWAEVFDSDRSERHRLMDEDERAELEALPQVVKIYRGGTEEGWSWTLDQKTAMWFANRFKRGWPVHTRNVDKSEIIALLNHRGEHEIIWRAEA